MTYHIKNYHGQFYYSIKHVRLSIVIDNECFSCFNKYNIVGWVKCTKVRY